MNSTAQPQQTPMVQKILGTKGLILFIALMNMFIPLSIDLYLPALPTMSAAFGSSAALTNLTLAVFMMAYAFGILIWGPISEKHGRKPVLLASFVVYIASSVLCAGATSVYALIIARALQGIGAGGITTVSMAVVKDCFTGKRRESILAIVQTMTGVAPMVAPIIGAWLLMVMDWRGSFWVLAIAGVIGLVMSFLFNETLRPEERYNGTLLGSLGRLVVVARNKSFTVPALIFSLPGVPFMGYLAISSFIYVRYFGLSEQTYSYFFAANSMLSVFGPLVYVKFLQGLDKKKLMFGCFAITLVSGLLVMTIGTLSPFLFLFSFMIASFMGPLTRPFSASVLLDQQKGDTGSAASLINTFMTVLGSLGMLAASIPWSNIVVGLGILISLFSVLSLVLWHLFLKSSIPFAGVKESS